MARDWTLAAMRLEGLLIPDGEIRNAPIATGMLAMATTPLHAVPRQSGAPEKNE
jgi:hypothetical protein